MRAVSNVDFSAVATLVLAIALGGCGKIKPNDKPQADAARAETKRLKAACGSSAGYERLKALLFDQAIARHNGDHANLDTLADYSTARMEDPVVEGWDPALDITRCRGRFILDIPPGAERGFGGERRLQADIGYTAQSAADGNGLVYRLNGAEPMIDKLAAFNVTGGRFRPPPAIDEQQAERGLSAPAANADAERTKSLASATVEQSGRIVANSSVSTAGQQTPTMQHATEPAAPEPSELAASYSAADGEATVRRFYAALGAGDGTLASVQMIPEKRSRGAFSAEAITRFYGKLPEPVRLTEVAPLTGGAYRVRYRYSAGRSRCDGSAVVSLTTRGGRALIRSIRALNGC